MKLKLKELINKLKEMAKESSNPEVEFPAGPW
jgi:hypothetical protein